MFEVVNRTVTEKEAKNIDSNICLLCNKGDNNCTICNGGSLDFIS